MAAIKPTPVIFRISLTEIFCNFFINPKRIHMVAAVNNSLYHTIIPSFRLMSRPSKPVNPAKKTAICNWRKAFFIEAANYEKDYGLARRLAICRIELLLYKSATQQTMIVVLQLVTPCTFSVSVSSLIIYTWISSGGDAKITFCKEFLLLW